MKHVLGRQARGLAPKAPLITIGRIKHRRNQGGRRLEAMRAQDTLGTIIRDNLRTY
jgi:hypothetical protein